MPNEKRGIGDAQTVVGIGKTRIAFGQAVERLKEVLGGRRVEARGQCPNCGYYNDKTALACARCQLELIT